MIAAGRDLVPEHAHERAELVEVTRALATDAPERLHDAVIDAHRRRAYAEGLALVLEAPIPVLQASLYLLAASHFDLIADLGEG